MDLERQRQLAKASKDWFDNELKPTILDNPRRYNMKLKDEAERKKRDLSVLPSTKSTAAVDKFVESCLNIYHTDPDSISFSAKSSGSTDADAFAAWLTEIFRYRSENSFPFFTWHHASLTACGTDGLESGLVWWRKDSYTEESEKFSALTGGQWVDVPKEAYDQGAAILPDHFRNETVQNEVVSCDSFWIEQLEPGVDVFWDPNIALLNVNLGQFGLVKVWRTVEEIQSLARQGVIDDINPEDLKQYQKSDSRNYDSMGITDSARANVNITNTNLGDKELIEFWMFFDKEGGRWGVQFSIEGKHQLSERKPVDDVFFGGRKVNRLPFVVGTTKLKLWKSAGRALPETIAPLEDQHSDHINNVNDAVKMSIQGRYRLNPDSDINVDDLLNRRIVYAESGEYERIEGDYGILSTMRVDDMVNMGINELIPVGMAGSGRGVVPKGTDKTLGAIQIGKMEGDEKQGVLIKTRNETFLKPILWLIAQAIFAYETDEEVLRKAAANAGITPPEVVTLDGRRMIDHTKLDFGVDVVINAGLGAAPRYQKAQSAIQIAGWRAQNGVPTDMMEIARHLNVLAGFGADQFTPKGAPTPPPPPKIDYKASVAIKFENLPPEAQQIVLQGLASAEGLQSGAPSDADMNLAAQNGGGVATPDRTGEVVDATGDAGMAMSQGGMQ